jgi:hypothetical protein
MVSSMEPTLAFYIFYSGVIALGVLLGGVFFFLWQTCVPRGATGRVVADLIAVTKGMAQADEAGRFLALYRRLLVSVGGYMARNIGGLVLACLPAVLILTLVAPAALDAWDRRATSFAVYPPHYQASAAGGAAKDRVELAVDGALPFVIDPRHRTAICWSRTHCTLFYLLGFEVRELPASLSDDASYVVIRPRHGNESILWPYLGNLEVAFFAAYILATLGGFLWPRRRR